MSLVGLGYRVLARSRQITIRDCVHYCGFRYGRAERNPYEEYARALVAGRPTRAARDELVDFLRHYRPRTFGQALGIELQRPYPLWQYPWSYRALIARDRAWVERPERVVDVMTHFSERGIPRALVEREFGWHERALERMQREGYRPHLLAHARVLVLQGPERSAYLLKDGNHRIAALSALGVPQVSALAVFTVVREHAARWPLVRAGKMSLADALAIFDAYHAGNPHPPRSAPVELV